MPFSIRPHRRFPVCCPVTYQAGLTEGRGTVWNLSLNGWCLSGDQPLRIREVCSLTVTLPPYKLIYVASGIVRWARGDEEYGIETLGIDDESREDVEEYLLQRGSEPAESIPRTTNASNAKARPLMKLPWRAE